MENKSIQQLRLFDTSDYRQPKEKKQPMWYYITDGREERMVVGFNREGRPIWDEHDLQHITPHVYNNSRVANVDVRRLNIEGKVKSCRYQVIGGKSVWS